MGNLLDWKCNYPSTKVIIIGLFIFNSLGCEQIVVVYDREGMTRKNFDPALLKFMIKFAGLLQDFYAERLCKMYVLNANWFYKMCYATIKPFLAKKTKEKVIS